MKHLIVVDVPRIKEFVFGTDKLTEIRGASALLDQLNRETMADTFRAHLGNSAVEVVFAGGGGGQFIVEADEKQVREVTEMVKKVFVQESAGGMRLVAGSAPLEEGKYRESLTVAFKALVREKEENPFEIHPAWHSGFIRECDSCSRSAAISVTSAGEERLLCEVCHRKIDYDKQASRGHWNDLLKDLQERFSVTETMHKPHDFEEIAAASTKGEYMALVYADGNGMGSIIKRISSSAEFRQFSRAVDKGIREACHEALWKHCLQKGGRADILLLGGDDLLVCITAQHAIPFAINVSRMFARKAGMEVPKKLLSQAGMSISLGIVFAKHRTPFSILKEQAEELLHSAKQAGASGGANPAYIDFHVASKYNQVSVASARERHLQMKLKSGSGMIRLYRKPYPVDELEELYKWADELTKAGIPRARLYRLGLAPSLGKLNCTLECIKLIGRTKKREHRDLIIKALERFQCASDIPWRPEANGGFSTVLADLVELCEFIGENREVDDAQV